MKNGVDLGAEAAFEAGRAGGGVGEVVFKLLIAGCPRQQHVLVVGVEEDEAVGFDADGVGGLEGGDVGEVNLPGEFITEGFGDEGAAIGGARTAEGEIHHGVAVTEDFLETLRPDAVGGLADAKENRVTADDDENLVGATAGPDEGAHLAHRGLVLRVGRDHRMKTHGRRMEVALDDGAAGEGEEDEAGNEAEKQRPGFEEGARGCRGSDVGRRWVGGRVAHRPKRRRAILRASATG